MNQALMDDLKKIKKGSRRRRFNKPPSDVYRVAYLHYDGSMAMRAWVTKVCNAWWKWVAPRDKEEQEWRKQWTT